MNKEIQPTELNNALFSDALNLRFKAQHKYIYPSAEEIVKEVKNE